MNCAKCNSPDVHVISIEWPGRQIGASIPVSMFTSASVAHHVCTSCGYIESYVDPDARAKIAEKWPLARS